MSFVFHLRSSSLILLVNLKSKDLQPSPHLLGSSSQPAASELKLSMLVYALYFTDIIL